MERYFWELMNPDPDDAYFKARAASFRNEFHDRITAVLYPLVFVIVAFALMSTPRSNRQLENLALIAAIGALATLRLIGLATEQMAKHMVMYLVLLACTSVAVLAVMAQNHRKLRPARTRQPARCQVSSWGHGAELELQRPAAREIREELF